MRDQCIEAMSRAIVKERGESPDSPVSQWFGVQDHGGHWKYVGPLWKVEGLPLATAALDTLLEKLKSPTEEMLEAGWDRTAFALEAWQAMLSTLSQKEGSA